MSVSEVIVLKERLRRFAVEVMSDAESIVKAIENAAQKGGRLDWMTVLGEWSDKYMRPYGLSIFSVGYGKDIDVAQLTPEDIKNVTAVVMELANDILPIAPDYAEEIVAQMGFFLVAAARAKYLLRKDIRKVPHEDEAAVVILCPELIKYTSTPDDTTNPAYTDYEPNSWQLKFTSPWNGIDTIYHAYVFGASGKFWRPSREKGKEFIVALPANHIVGVGEILDVRLYRIASRSWPTTPVMTPPTFDDLAKDANKMLYPLRGVPAVMIDYEMSGGLVEELVLPNPEKRTEPITKNVRVVGIAFVNYERISSISSIASV